MNASELQALERKLDALLDKVDVALQDSRDAGEPVKLDQTTVGRLSRMDALQQQSMRVGLREGLLTQRRRIEAALARIHEGVYGVCCACQEPLTPGRLKADPAAPFCVVCEELRQSSKS